ncbi:MAG: TonB-dependent receptor [Pseudomonadota bacterium]|uniref:TonB-dependent receptor n=1 Tax=Phenylobacterium sp. TaxID=1871053 RepID=UPI0025EEBCAE|nr:TonB-dependent receptor [Phenylobacterium sp.]MBT9473181.1 TonB-dependent receptor [Phenylobacterium sp.]
MRHMMRTASWAILAAACAASPALAQDQGTVAELVVTAQKREQNLQDVPIVVTTLPQRQLQDAGVRDIKDLQVLAPGLSVTSSTSEAQTSARIRGVGTIGDNPGLESSVGTVIDGVYRSRSGVAFGDLGELERVEILKGPQGTLFGKNTSAGVINVITKPPSFDFGANGEVTYGNHGARGLAASVTGPIAGDVMAGRIYVAKRERDGFAHVLTGAGPRTRTDDTDQNYYTVRGQLLIEPTSAVVVKLLADFSKRDEHCCVNFVTVAGPTAALVDALAADAGVMRPANPYARVAHANRDMGSKITDKGVSAQLDWNINEDVSLTSITAFRDWRAENGSDIDFSSADIWYRSADGSSFSEIKAFSQEVRLAGATENLNWLVGAFYSDESLRAQATTTFGSAYETYFSLLLSGGANPAAVSALTGLPVGTNFPAGQGPRDSFDHTSKGWALFTNNSWKVTDAFELTLGLRYSDDEKTVESHYTNSVPAAACAAAIVRPIPAGARAAICAPHSDPAFNNIVTHQDAGEGRWSGTLKGSYRFNEGVMAYASYAEGFKSGGFNLDRSRKAIGVIDPNTGFPAETVTSYELGVKTNTAGYGLVANATLFHQTYEDFQLNTYTGISWLVASIPEVVSRGVDLDLMWRTPLEGLSFSGGVTYAETQFGDFAPPAGISPRLPNSRLSYAPLWSAAGTASYKRPIGDNLEFRASLSAKYTSEYNTGSNLDPMKSQKPMTLVNARLVLGSADERWSAELWSQNLTDEDYNQVVVDQPLQTGTFATFLAPPRTYGVTLRARF